MAIRQKLNRAGRDNLRLKFNSYPTSLPSQISSRRSTPLTSDEIYYKVGRTTHWTAGQYNACSSVVYLDEETETKKLPSSLVILKTRWICTTITTVNTWLVKLYAFWVFSQIGLLVQVGILEVRRLMAREKQSACTVQEALSVARKVLPWTSVMYRHKYDLCRHRNPVVSYSPQVCKWQIGARTSVMDDWL